MKDDVKAVGRHRLYYLRNRERLKAEALARYYDKGCPQAKLRDTAKESNKRRLREFFDRRLLGIAKMIKMECGHPKECIRPVPTGGAADRDADFHCGWCREVNDLKEKIKTLDKQVHIDE